MRWSLLADLAGEAAPEDWHYAAWVALDARLLLLVLCLSLLVAAGITALFVRGRRWTEVAGLYLVCFVLSVAVFTWVFNEIAVYPVLVVESVFRFP